MKKKISALAILVLMSLLGFLQAENVEVTVLDEQSKPVKGATVDVWYAGFQGDGSGDKKSSGASDRNGKYIGKGEAAMHIEVHVSKQGWYTSKSKMFPKGKDHNVTLLLRKIEKPIPLYVRKVRLEFPTFDKWLGFDFEAGDWVAPHGKGKSRDIVFKFQREYMGSDYSEKELAELIHRVKEAKEKRGEKWDAEEFKLRTANWKSEFQMAFQSKLEGIVEEEDGYLIYSKMKMPHKAPEGGYKNDEVIINKKSYRTKEDEREGLDKLRKYIKSGMPEPKSTGFFIRTRVMEVEGEIIKASYVKLPQAIKVEAKGVIEFMYYFNPAPNDRNLEFNPKANLAIEQNRAYDS